MNNRQMSNSQAANDVALFSAIAVGIGFVLLPWMNFRDVAVTGLQWVNDFSLLWIILVATIVGGGAAILGLMNKLPQTIGRSIICSAGIAIIVHYSIYFSIFPDMLPFMGIGFWITLLGAIGLIWQVIIPPIPFRLRRTGDPAKTATQAPYLDGAAQTEELEEIFESSKKRAGSLVPSVNIYAAPWWLVILVIMWVYIAFQMSRDVDYVNAVNSVRDGTPFTIWVAIASYLLALIIGLVTGIIRATPPEKPTNRMPWDKRVRRVLSIYVYNGATVYVEIMRGIPPLVFLLIAGFIVVPQIRDGILPTVEAIWVPLNNNIIAPVFNALFNHPELHTTTPIVKDIFAIPFVGDFFGSIFREYPQVETLHWRGRDEATAILGLGLVYGAFLSEVFRAGIQAVPKGQFEAAKSVGMTYFQTMRHVVIPQAIRNVLPPLGNNFISMIKDTSLVTILGASDLTQEAKKWAGSEFTYVPTYTVLSFVYLTLTVSGSMLVQTMEKRLQSFNKN